VPSVPRKRPREICAALLLVRTQYSRGRWLHSQLHSDRHHARRFALGDARSGRGRECCHSCFDILSHKSPLAMSDFRLGDVIDDHCIKCRRVTNHSIVSLVSGEPAKVRCRTCYHDHDYRHEQAPPSKKDLKKAELFKEVLAAAVPAAADPPGDPDPSAKPAKKATARGKRA
jgi:hypothetical protein